MYCCQTIESLSFAYSYCCAVLVVALPSCQLVVLGRGLHPVSFCWVCFGRLHTLTWPFPGVFLFFPGCQRLVDQVSVFCPAGSPILLQPSAAVAPRLVVYRFVVYRCFLFYFYGWWCLLIYPVLAMLLGPGMGHFLGAFTVAVSSYLSISLRLLPSTSLRVRLGFDPGAIRRDLVCSSHPHNHPIL